MTPPLSCAVEATAVGFSTSPPLTTPEPLPRCVRSHLLRVSARYRATLLSLANARRVSRIAIARRMRYARTAHADVRVR